MKRMGLAAIMAVLLLTSGCLIESSPVYYVLFEEKPDLDDQLVYARGIQIGRIMSDALGESDVVEVKVSITKKYSDRIKENVVFVVDDGKLELDAIGETGAPLPENSRILGFESTTALAWFKTKNKFKEISDQASNKLDELYRKMKE